MAKQERKRITSSVGAKSDLVLFQLLEEAEPGDQPGFYKHLATIGALEVMRQRRAGQSPGQGGQNTDEEPMINLDGALS